MSRITHNNTFWNELKRRKVVRSVSVYAAMAFVTLQVVDLVEKPLGLPEWTPGLIIVLLCVGFIITLYISWIYDLTPKGIKRTRPVRTVGNNTSSPSKASPGWKIATFASMVIVLGLIGSRFISKGTTDEKLLKNEKSIAVLPFLNLSNDPQQEFFSEGVVLMILDHLYKIGGLEIPASASTSRFKDTKLPVRKIARRLGVTYILEGWVSRSPDSVAIGVNLINGIEGHIIWSETYKRFMSAANVIDIQSNVAQQVAQSMKVYVSPDVIKRIEARPTENTEAYLLFMQATNSDMEMPYDKRKSILRKAITLDPNYADAYGALAFNMVESGGHDGNMNRSEVIKEAEPLINRSLQLDSTSLFAHTANALLSLFYYWKFDVVENEFKKIMSLSPSNLTLNVVFSDYLLAAEKYSEAFLLSKKAFDLDKNSLYTYVEMALTYYFDGQPDKAYETIKKTRDLFPENNFVFLNSLRIFVYTSKYTEAMDLFNGLLDSKKYIGSIPWELGFLGVASYKSGEKRISDACLKELLTRSSISPIGSPSFFAAAIYSAMGDTDQSLNMLKRSYENHEVELYWLKVEPLFRTLHGDPRYQDLLMKIGFKNSRL